VCSVRRVTTARDGWTGIVLATAMGLVLASVSVLVVLHRPGTTGAAPFSLPVVAQVAPDTLYFALWRAGFSLGVVAALWVLASRNALRPASVFGVGIALLGFLYGAKVQSRLLDQPMPAALLVPPAELFAPGYRIPLALVTMMAVGLVWAVAWRADWRAMGDALALLGPVLQAVGRLGCFVNGCCTGTLSDLPWAVVHDHRSDAHMLHASMDWIDQGALASLPVHPLPLYYASFGAVLALVMILMVRRGASSGSLLVLAVAVEPPFRLALEQLRGGFPWRDWTPIVATLAAWTVVDATALAAWLWPERRGARGKSPPGAPSAPSPRGVRNPCDAPPWLPPVT
jgi:prolipoprotein diacylglyceryltransferase